MIVRDPAVAAGEKFDVIIIGGGFYGVMLLLEASRRRLRALLLERADFGSGVSSNSLKIIHGGLRYLQTLDLSRFRESVRERHWFLKTFPQLVVPLPCVMPLDGKGLNHPLVVGAALAMNDFLSWQRNVNLQPTSMIPRGEILTTKDTQKLFPGVPLKQIERSALWYDAYVPDSQRLLMEILRWGSRLGGVALNYVEALDVRKHAGEITVTAVDREDGKYHEFTGQTVVNAAGPESRLLASKFHRDIPALFRPSIGWNLLLDRPALSTHALAITSRRKERRTYFLLPWKGKLLAGTGHAPWTGPPQGPRLATHLLRDFLEDINFCIPYLELDTNSVLRIFIGFLPATKEGAATNPSREVIVDHGRCGGPSGLYSVSGVKFTTSRSVAEKTLVRMFPDQVTLDNSGPSLAHYVAANCLDYDWMPPLTDNTWMNWLTELVAEEAVLHLDDLLFRRTALGDNPARARVLAPHIARLFTWDAKRRSAELKAVEESLNIEKTLL